MSQRSFIVVGGGLGGLATGLRLAHRGHRVTLFEKNSAIGGRNTSLTVNDCIFDIGPTLLMMLDPFYKLFRDVGERFEDHLDISLCDPNYRVFYSDGNQIDSTTNMAKMVRSIERLSGPVDAASYPKMIGKVGEMYHESLPSFVRKNYDSPLDLVRLSAGKMALKHGMLGNLAAGMKKYYADPRLQMLFSFQTMYLGLSPHDAPWVYAVLVYMEYGEGIWYPKGGLTEISRKVGMLAQQRGVDIRLNAPVAAIDGKSVRLKSGDVFTADAVICNADLPYAERDLAPTKQPPKPHRYSCSAYNVYMDYEGELPDLLHHDIMLGSNFDENLDQIFNRREIPTDPAFYVAASCKTEPSMAPPGHSNLQILVPCPNLDHPWTEGDAINLETKAFARLTKEVGFDPGKIRGFKRITPTDWKRDLNLDRGATFGLSHDFMQTACFRPSNKSKANPGLYYVGAGTVPGNGLPMVLISAELAEQRLEKDGLL